MRKSNNFVNIIFALCTFCKASPDLPGHMQKLGSHRPAEGVIASIDKVPPPQEFYERYVAASTPVIFKGAARQSQAYRLWTDRYLRDRYGDIKVEVDLNKADNRVARSARMRLEMFLEVYNTTDCYLVQTLPRPMWGDFPLLHCVLCGGFTERLQDVVVWFSAGGTKSKLHLDTVENINCLISGHKEWFFVDPHYTSLVQLDRTDSDFSSINVDRVDMFASPGLARVPWWSAITEAGDCLYVPYRWLHQVNSYERNIAVNLWWTPMSEFNHTDCQGKAVMFTSCSLCALCLTSAAHSQVAGQRAASLDHHSFAPGEQIRFFLENMLDKNGGGMSFDEVHHLLLHEHTGEHLVAMNEFRVLDQNNDGSFQKEDLQMLSSKQIASLIKAAPGEINTVGVSQADFTPQQPTVEEWTEEEDEEDEKFVKEEGEQFTSVNAKLRTTGVESKEEIDNTEGNAVSYDKQEQLTARLTRHEL